MTAWLTILTAVLAAGAGPDDPVVTIDAGRVLHRVSPLLTGACIEDVNHEIYGGLYSQMIFGESFQEPSPPLPLNGFTAYGGQWRPQGTEGELWADGGDGPKLLADRSEITTGEVGVEVFFPSRQAGNAGLIVKVNDAGVGADKFTGYEVSLETSGKLVIGRHRQNWEPIQNVPCAVPVERWIALVVRLRATGFDVLVDGKPVTTFEDKEHPLAPGRVGLRTWQRPARYRNLHVKAGDSFRKVPFELVATDRFGDGVSGMWRALRRGPGRGEFALETTTPFVGRQSQRISFRDGDGAIGIENRGLNRWGLNVVAGKPFEGYVWARAAQPTVVSLALESDDGEQTYAETSIDVQAKAWTRHDFTLTPRAADRKGRFALTLKQPGSVAIGHVFLQPGPWGRFQGLTDRKDVGDALVAQGLTVLRYGGSMINHPEYRWKKMIGPRDRRPPSPGTWYPYSSNGWGIFDFLNFCEAAGFVAIPALHMGESPQDMADFVEYANGPADSEWGRKRVADGHPGPYRLKHVELGNEEAVNENYWRKFQPMAEAMWAKDPGLVLIVGDFAYGKVIDDPFHFSGGVAVNTLAAHQKILELARKHDREVWFDIHIGTEQPPAPRGLRAERSFIEQLGKIAPGARYKVVIFEFNSGNHAQKRALSNALALNEVERIGDLLPIACSANCLQPDGQNDNGWDQGLLFLNPARVWLQPPGYVTRMARRFYQPLLVQSAIQGRADKLSVNAKRGEDGKTLVLQVVNWADQPQPAQIQLAGFVPSQPVADVEELAGPLDAVNTAEQPERLAPRTSSWRHALKDGKTAYTFPPHSFTVVRFQ